MLCTRDDMIAMADGFVRTEIKDETLYFRRFTPRQEQINDN